MKKYFISTILPVIIVIIVFGGLSFYLSKVHGPLSPNYDLFEFSRQKPELVRALKTRYEEEIKKVESNLLKTEKSAQDKLIEEVTNQLDPKK